MRLQVWQMSGKVYLDVPMSNYRLTDAGVGRVQTGLLEQEGH